MRVNLTKGSIVGYVVHPVGAGYPSTFFLAEPDKDNPLAFMSVTVGWPGRRRSPGMLLTWTGDVREAVHICRRHLYRYGTWVQRVQIIRTPPEGPQDDWPKEEYEHNTPADDLASEIALDYL